MSRPFRVLILGGGTSGWMCAAAMAVALKPGTQGSCYDVRVIESDEIGTVGVGEATLPHIREFNQYLGINEIEFMRETQATIKLGIEFVDWGKLGNRYIHPFGTYGQPMAGVEFHHVWSRAMQFGKASPLEAYSYSVMAARNLKFDFPSEDLNSIKSTYDYAYHFDAGLYAAFLRRFAEERGLKRTEGRVIGSELCTETGEIRRLKLASGEVVEADFFIDCSGFSGLLIEKQLQVAWEDWTPWLPCDRAMAVPSARTEPLAPYTRSTAREAGWQWRIPLQHRTGNGYVYASAFLNDDAASDMLLRNLDGPAMGDVRPLRFTAGRRRESWSRNCVAIGLSSGFLEPLESTSIYLIQIAVFNLLRLFPTHQKNTELSQEFNRRVDIEYERVRDFLILHYHANTREDSALWEHVRHMAVPDSLSEKLEQFRRRGHISKYRDGLFSPPSWLAVFFGQDVHAESYNRIADKLDPDILNEKLAELEARIASNVAEMTPHDEFIRSYCMAAPMPQAHSVLEGLR